METLENAPLDLLADDLAALTWDIHLLKKFWNDKEAQPSAVLGLNSTSGSDGVRDPRFWAGLREICNGSTVGAHWPEVREFIHNFCTNLCAEKIMVQDEINKRAGQ